MNTLSVERRAELELEKTISIDETITQRRIIKRCVGMFCKKIDLELNYELDLFVSDVLSDAEIEQLVILAQNGEF